VTHPSCQTGEQKRRADAYHNGGLGGLVLFELSRGKAAGQAFIEALEMFYHAASFFDDACNTGIHPASTTHSQFSAKVSSNRCLGYLYPFAIGIEHIDDIIADLEKALAEA
jgi:O-acetylhomoserine (thiol)-lyase